jgi:hypothetical protein
MAERDQRRLQERKEIDECQDQGETWNSVRRILGESSEGASERPTKVFKASGKDLEEAV